MVTGFVLGKFMPFHKGHMALIEYAKSNCDKLLILVAASPDEPIPYKYRLKWVLSTYLDDPKVEVFGLNAEEPKFETSDELSAFWGHLVRERFGKIDRIFTSEDYGKVFAEIAGAENWVFDKSRNIIPVSATMIRNKPLTNWDYLSNFAKDYYVKKIAIVGTESTGKTTLAQHLAEHYNTVWCPETARDLNIGSTNFSMDDLQLIATEHAKNIIKHTRLANKLLFIDTDLLITKGYAQYAFNQELKVDPWVEKANEVDLYIYLMKDAPYVDDGSRLPKEERDKLDDFHYKNIFVGHKSLHMFPFPHTYIKEEDSEDKQKMKINYAYVDRYRQIKQYLEAFITKF
jgi:HTH-type transcriptional repressor of NAD biosynthesis genes